MNNKELIIELARLVKEGKKTWKEQADTFNKETGLDISAEALRKRFAGLGIDLSTEATIVSQESNGNEFTTIYGNGTHTVHDREEYTYYDYYGYNKIDLYGQWDIDET